MKLGALLTRILSFSKAKKAIALRFEFLDRKNAMDFSLDEKQLSFKKALIDLASPRPCLQGQQPLVQYQCANMEL
jgi:hypothetical protein